MTDPRLSCSRTYTRREMLEMAAGAGVAAALPFGRARAAAAPVLTRVVPRTGERLPVVGLGTAIVFDIGEDAEMRAQGLPSKKQSPASPGLVISTDARAHRLL